MKTRLNKICDTIEKETKCRDGLCAAFWVAVMVTAVYLLSSYGRP